ncbi:MAG TPA: hypothetical protein VD966_08890, partial [Pyrinomonadaceae bacterium]|nr:hypothetical protein [Pyrinomonadaceae bacterium]
MADSPDTDALIKREPEAPAPDPIISRSTSGILLISALLLTAVLAWSLYDEIIGQRPWKGIQREFADRYNAYLRSIRGRARQTEREVKESPEYQQLADDAKAAQEAAEPRKQEIDRDVRVIDDQLAAITDAFQDIRGRIAVVNYEIETAESESAKKKKLQEATDIKQEAATIYMPAGDGSQKIEEQKLTYPQIEKLYNDLKEQKARLLVERGELLKEYNELAKKRDDYLKNSIVGLSDPQIAKLIERNDNLDVTMRQINVLEYDIVDRCETCHLGVREPLTLTPANMSPDGPGKKPDDLARAFVSHPNKELLKIHDPEKFGCSSCHGGNGRATTSVVKGHGRHRFWLHPLYGKENMQAGCQQCHTNDRVLDGAPVLTLGKDMFQERGCVGCHRMEGFDREADALTNTRQAISQLEEQIATNERESRQTNDAVAEAASDEEARKLLAHAQSLRVTNSQLAARIEQLRTQASYLMQDQKKVGPNLKDVRLKLQKEWIPVWLQNPQAFRPGTKMPTYWRIDGHGNGAPQSNEREENERKAIAAFIWQEGFQGEVPRQEKRGDAARGKQIFETIGCMACHSVGEGEARV